MLIHLHKQATTTPKVRAVGDGQCPHGHRQGGHGGKVKVKVQVASPVPLSTSITLCAGATAGPHRPAWPIQSSLFNCRSRRAAGLLSMLRGVTGSSAAWDFGVGRRFR